MATRRNDDDRDEEILRRKNGVLSAAFVVVAILAALMGGLILQTVKGWLPSNGGGGAAPDPSLARRVSILEQSDKEQDVAIRRLRYDLSNHLRFHGIQLGSDGRPVGAKDQ